MASYLTIIYGFCPEKAQRNTGGNSSTEEFSQDCPGWFSQATSLAALHGGTWRESGSKIYWSQKDCSNHQKREVIQVWMRAETIAGREKKRCI